MSRVQTTRSPQNTNSATQEGAHRTFWEPLAYIIVQVWDEILLLVAKENMNIYPVGIMFLAAYSLSLFP
jgi:hypothetical protein